MTKSNFLIVESKELEEIKEIIKTTPNNSNLGKKIREYINKQKK